MRKSYRCKKCKAGKYPSGSFMEQWICGRISNIPWHCRLFYYFIWFPMVKRFVWEHNNSLISNLVYSLYTSYFKLADKRNFIPCPICAIFKSKCKVKYC